MSIEIQCNGCGSTLRVAEEHRGKQARCPKCGTIQWVASSGTEAPPATPAPPPIAPPVAPDRDRWWLRTPDGRQFGPVSESELDQWVGESRVSAECQLRREQESAWMPATVRYPNLPRTAARGYDRGELISARPSNAYAEEHRGAWVLTFGILGLLLTCPLLSIMAWVMGAKDLAKMNAGIMDPAGRDLTRVGYVLGLFWSLICIAMMLGVMFLFIANLG